MVDLNARSATKIMGWENVLGLYCIKQENGLYKEVGISFKDWNPIKDYSHLMMIIEKMIEAGKYWLSACIEKDGYSVEVFDENSWRDNTPENLGESKLLRTYNLAVIEACLQAIEEAKGVE